MHDTPIPQRQDVSRELTWNLESIFPTPQAWEQDVTALQNLLPRLTTLQGALGADAQHLLAALRLRDQVGMILEKLVFFAQLRRDEDRTNATSQARYDQAMALKVQVAAVTAFIIPELLTIDESCLHEFICTSPELHIYVYHLNTIQRQRPYRRSGEVETLLAQAGEVLLAPRRIFERMHTSPAPVHDSGGKEYPGGWYLNHSDRELRRQSFKALYTVRSKHLHAYAQALSSHVKTRLFLAQVRGYRSTLEMVLSEQWLPVSVYENLLEIVNQNRFVYQRCLRLRKRLLGLHELHLYDLEVPIVVQRDRAISFDEAKRLIAQSLSFMGDEYLQMLAMIYNKPYIDAAVNVGKAPGSYAGAIYGSLPFVFLSYRERLADVYTLTHELGHALHTSFAQKQQPFVYANLSTPGGFLAEVASNVHEMLLTQYLLKTAIEKQTRLAALGRVLDAYQTAFFVPMLYAQFEYAMYHAAEAGQALTAEYLNSTFMESMKRQYGTEIVLDEVSAVRWSFSAHLYESFYSFQYATGVAIAASLVQQMLREGEPSINRYHDFLRSGKSGDSLHLLEDAGVDMLTPEPIKQAITLFESYLEEMESLV